MNEEKKIEEMVIEESPIEEVVDTYPENETSSNNGYKKVVVGAVIAAASLGVLWWSKNRGKLDEWRIKKLEKKGYQVIKPEIVEEDHFQGETFEEEIEE